MLAKFFFKHKEILPVTSLLIILFTLFTVAFFQISLRRLSYALYQANKSFDKVQDEHYSLLRNYRKRTQTKRLDEMAKEHSLHNKTKGQIIQVINGQATVID